MLSNHLPKLFLSEWQFFKLKPVESRYFSAPRLVNYIVHNFPVAGSCGLIPITVEKRSMLGVLFVPFNK